MLDTTEETKIGWDVSERLYLSALAGELLPDSRTAWCMHTREKKTEDIEVRRHGRKAWYSNLKRCGSAWLCAWCAHKITLERLDQINKALLMSHTDYTPVLFTYTLRHDRDTALKFSLSLLLESFRFMKQQRAWRETRDQVFQFSSSVRALEITYGDANGWHPHIHEILFIPRSLIAEFGIADLQDEYTRAMTQIHWLPALARCGGYADGAHGFDAKIGTGKIVQYLAKWGHAPMPANATEKISFELARGQFKSARLKSETPFSLLWRWGDTDNPRFSGLFREYADAIKGRNQFRWGNNARAILEFEDKSDQELAEMESHEFDCLAVLTLDDWRIVLKRGARARILEIAQSGDMTDLNAYLSSIGIERF